MRWRTMRRWTCGSVTTTMTSSNKENADVKGVIKKEDDRVVTRRRTSSSNQDKEDYQL